MNKEEIDNRVENFSSNLSKFSLLNKIVSFKLKGIHTSFLDYKKSTNNMMHYELYSKILCHPTYQMEYEVE